MPYRKRYIPTLTGGLGLLLLVLCTNDYNPFADTGNARMHIDEQSFYDGDTVRIFSTQSLTLIPAVAELIDSFTIDAEGSRRCRDTLIAAPATATRYRFAFSFVDTGNLTVTINTYRRGGDLSVRTLRVRAISPLHQDTVRGLYGEAIELATDSVGDDDVLYTWSFGGRDVVQSLYPRVSDTLRSAYTDSGSGKLWVTDGTNRSPATTFSFMLSDTGAPLIEWVNEHRGDTLSSASSEVLFKVRITDRGRGEIHYAEINGEEVGFNRNHIYTRLFTGLDAYPPTRPLRVTVRALDNLVDGHWAADTFWLAYDESGTSGTITELFIGNITRDTVTSRTPRYRIFGSVRDYGQRTVSVELTANGNGVGDTIFGTGSGQWDWSFGLDSSHNDILISARDTSHTLLASRRVTIIHNPAAVDTTGPVVLALTVNGRDGRTIYTTDTLGVVRVQAFDVRTGVASVIIDSVAALPGDDHVWSRTIVPLVHSPRGIVIDIVALDSLGNGTDTTVTVFSNHLPRITAPPALPYPASAGTVYTTHIGMSDPDGEDTVRVIGKHLPPNMELRANGTIHWTPTLTDTGRDSIVVQLFDGIQYTEWVGWPVMVIDARNRPAKLRLVTGADDIPAFLEANADTLRLEPAVEPGTGKPPYAYAARLRQPAHLLLDSGAGNRVVWAPALADTGRRMLELVAWDNYHDSDTLHAGLLVVPPNRPCTLTVGLPPDTTATGAVDLSDGSTPETLTVRVSDPDLVYGPPAERHAVRMSEGGMSNEVGVDTAGFTRVVLDPAVRDTGSDTLRVVVEDRTGSRDTVEVAVYYGAPPGEVQLLSPADSAVVNDTAVTLRWRCDDPDGNPLVYDLSFGAGGDEQVVAAGIADTTIRITGLTRSGTRYWHVRARDRKSARESEKRMVTLRNPRQVRLATSGDDFPRWIEAGTTMRVVLRVVPGSGNAPLRYSAVETKSGTPLLSEGTDSVVSWTPAPADTGYRYPRAMVRDGWGNADTLEASVLVVPPNHHPCSLSVEHDGQVGAEGAVDLFSSPDSVTLTYTIHDKDHLLTERYGVRIIRTGTESRTTIDTTRQFRVIVRRAAGRTGTDTIRVIVSDRTQTSDTLDVRIWHGPDEPQEYVKRVIVNTSSTGVPLSSSLYDFPLLLRLSSSTFDFTRAHRNGEGLRFRSAGGSAMRFEIERWDSAGGRAEVWVRVPRIKPDDAAQYFELYVDSGDMTDGSNGRAVFRGSDGFAAVWHMHDQGTTLSDATGNGNDAATEGSRGSLGRIDGAHRLDYGEQARVSDTDALDLSGSITASAWIRIPDIEEEWYGVFSKRGWSSTGFSFFIEYYNDHFRPAARIGYSDIPIRSTTPVTLTSDTWYHIAWRLNDNTNTITFFIDGQRLGVPVQAFTWLSSGMAALEIGVEGGDDWLNGFIDEARLSATTRGDEWIRLCYENQRGESTLVTIE
jgi:hypothetical protein